MYLMCNVYRLYEKLSEDDQAAAAYTEYINEMYCVEVSGAHVYTVAVYF